MEQLSLLQAIVNGGPAVILAVALYVVWRTWRAELKEHQKFIQDMQEQRVKDALDWSSKYQEMVGKVRETLVNLDGFTKTVEKVLVSGDRDGPAG